jgi:predicted XRE-type DNA-binding protein
VIKQQNTDVRAAIKASGLKQYEVATLMNVSASYLSQLLLQPLSEGHKKRIMAAIKQGESLKGEQE